MTKTLSGRRTAKATVWQRVVPRAAVRTPGPVSKSTRKLARTSMPIPLQDMEKVATTLGKSRRDVRRRLSPGSSTASSGAEAPEKPQVTSNAMAARSRRRVRQLLKLHKDLAPGQSFLELRAVQPESAAHYKQSLQVMEWTNTTGRGLVEDNMVDDALVGFMNDRFFAGLHAHVMKRLICRADVRSTRVLQDRVRDYAQGPSRSRRPYSLPAWAAIANEVAGQGYRLMSLACPPKLQTYLRPSELKQLHKMDLIEAKKGVLNSSILIVCPQERNQPTKTVGWDDSVLLDCE